MKKQLGRGLSMLLALAMAAGFLTVGASGSEAGPDTPSTSVIEQGTCGNSVTYTLDRTGLLAIHGSGAMDDYNDSSSPAPWFSSRASVERVEIASGVTTIGTYAFYSCSNLTSITIPDTVAVIGNKACDKCSSLTGFSVDAGSQAFRSLDGVLYNADQTLLVRCPEALSSITIPDTVTSIGSNAFLDCSSLTGVTIPNSVTKIEPYAFYSSGLTSVTIPGSVTDIGRYAFGYCRNLTSAVIQRGVSSIGEDMFSSCSKLTSVTIPDTVTSIGSNAFLLSGLTSVTVPSGVTSIGAQAFGLCSNLTSISVDPGNQNYSSLNGILCNKSQTDLIKYPEGLFSAAIPDSVSTLKGYSFAGCSKLTSITIPDNVTAIDGMTFSNCSNLTSATFLGSAPTITNSVFSNVSQIVLRYPYGDSSWDSVKGQNLGAQRAEWLAYGPTEITTAESELVISPQSNTGTVTLISSNLPFHTANAQNAANYELTGSSFRIAGAKVTGSKTVELTLESAQGSASKANDLSIGVKAAAFDAELTDASAAPITVSSAPPIPIAGAAVQPTPTPTPAPTPSPAPERPRPAKPAVLPSTDTTADPAPAPSPEPILPPGKDVALPPESEPASPIQGAVKDETGIVDWVERIELPGYAATLYGVLSPRREETPDYLAQDLYFTCPDEPSGTGSYDVETVEQVDFDLADLFSNGVPSLGVSVFTDDNFYRVDAADSDRQINYSTLQPGEAVRTPAFNGIFITSIPTGSQFDEEKKTACSYISTVYQAFDRDHPEVFWLSGKCRVRIPTVDGTAYFFLVLADKDGFTMRSPDWTADGAVANGIQRRDKAVEQILAAAAAGTPAETVRLLNRWLTEHNQYNTTPDLTTIGNEPHECLSALEGRIGPNGPVCDGYSRAFKVLCDRLGIPCVLENGYAKTTPDSKGSLHMWNAVEISSTWYGVDVTWNDPTVKGSTTAKSGKENEQFLLVGASTVIREMTFAASHPATNRATGDGVAFDSGPELSSIAFSALTANAQLYALPFTDVADGAWYYGPVSFVYQQDLMLGTSSHTFSPDSLTTRQQLWMILARMDGAQPQDLTAARTWAMSAGISDGSSPDGFLTREQLVTILYRYCSRKGCDTSASAPLSGFTDAGSVSGYARPAMSWAVSGGIINGMGDGTISPGGTASRAQLAAVIERFCQSMDD